jgi:hypothetical protein
VPPFQTHFSKQTSKFFSKLKTPLRKIKQIILINLHFTVNHQILPLSFLLGIFLLRRVLS